MKLEILLLLGTVAVLGAASPARMFSSGSRLNSASRQPITTVDCSNREAVEFVAKTHANFRCVYPNRRRGSGAIDNDPSAASLFSIPEQPEQQQSFFPAGLESASLVRADPTKCKPGYMYSLDVGMCLQYSRPSASKPLESDSLVVDQPRLEISAFLNSPRSAKDCKENEVFSLDLGTCMPIGPQNGGGRITPPSRNLISQNRPVRLEIESFPSSSQTAADCKEGQTYIGETSLCVDVDLRHPVESANLVRTDSVVPLGKVISQKRRPCPEGEIYTGELDTCLPANPPKNVKPLVSDSLIQERPQAAAVPTRQDLVCGPGFIPVPEIGICQPLVRPEERPTPPSSSSLVKEPEKLEIRAFEDSTSTSQCPPGSFFVPSLDLCLTP